MSLIRCLLIVFILLTTFARAVQIDSNDQFKQVIYDYNYHKFIAIGKFGLVATSVDGKKWVGSQIKEEQSLLAIESSVSNKAGVTLFSPSKVYTFHPDTNTSEIVETLSGRKAYIVKPDAGNPSLHYEVFRVSEKSSVVAKCSSLTNKCTDIYTVNGEVKQAISPDMNQLVIVIEKMDGSTENLICADTGRTTSFVPFKLSNTNSDSHELTSDGSLLYDWRLFAWGNEETRDIIRQIYLPSRIRGRMTEWTPLAQYHQPERLEHDTYAAYFGDVEQGLSDDEDEGTLVIAGVDRENQVELFAAELSVSNKIFRPLLTSQVNNVGRRTCGASARIDGKVVTVLLGSGNKVLLSTDIKKLWKTYDMNSGA